jgi:EAL domain-containing protein (putative c-di-GMP-specific phosphodiesterase class I)
MEALAQGVYWKDTLTRALTEGQLFFHFQPVADAKTGAIVYHEALLRLTLEDGQVAMPHEFLAPAQRAGLMQELDGFVVRAAMEALLTYSSKRLAVNLSAAALSDTRWAEPLTEAVHMQRFDPERLIFEITETAAIADMPTARHIMDALRRQGFRFTLDDFGAGFSSLYYLKHLPVTYVKIDRSLIKDLTTDEGNRNFVRAITTMVHAYGKKVIGEGVENAETLAMLREIGVDLVQGFYISHPSEKGDQTFWGPDRAGLM